MIDITELKRTELKRGQIKLANILFEYIPLMFYLKDQEGRFQDCTETFARFVGLPRKDISGRDAAQLGLQHAEEIRRHDRELDGRMAWKEFDRLYRDNPEEATQKVEHQYTLLWHVEAPSRANHEIRVSEKRYPGVEGQGGGVFGFFVDETERQRGENRLRFGALGEVVAGVAQISRTPRRRSGTTPPCCGS